MANLVIFFKNPRNVANLVDFLFYKRKFFEGSLAPHPIFFLQVVSHSRVYFSIFIYCAEKDWLKRSTVRTQPRFSFSGGVEDFSRFRSLRRFWTFLCCVVLCCVRACVWKEGVSSLSFLSSSRVATNCGVTHACTLPRSVAPSVQAAAWASPPLPPAPSLLYLRTEHLNKRRKEPLETESQGAVLWSCKVVYYYLLGRKKEKGFCKLALA
jgi:hypothetical protein